MNLYIVSGTTKGLGKALLEKLFADATNEVIALARAPDTVVDGGAIFRLDLSDTRAIDEVFDRIGKYLGDRRFEKAVLINNAGVVSPVGPIELCNPLDVERSLLVNLVAPMLLMGRFLRLTEDRAPVRRVINISSGAGRRPIAGWSAYCVAKAGLDMASRVAALEAETRKIGRAHV